MYSDYFGSSVGNFRNQPIYKMMHTAANEHPFIYLIIINFHKCVLTIVHFYYCVFYLTVNAVHYSAARSVIKIKQVSVAVYLPAYCYFLLILALFAAVEQGQLEKARNILTTFEVQVNR